uniref:Uncharacterized protein n=1 Tax=Arundo donax TaxID=35708 RepID=A0A0A9FP05_ARUDO
MDQRHVIPLLHSLPLLGSELLVLLPFVLVFVSRRNLLRIWWFLGIGFTRPGPDRWGFLLGMVCESQLVTRKGVGDTRSELINEEAINQDLVARIGGCSCVGFLG